MTGSEEIQHINKLIVKGEFKEASTRLEQMEKGGIIATNDQLRILLLKGRVMIGQGQYEGALNLSQQALKESQRLGEQLNVVDALIIQEEALWKLGRLGL